MDIVDIFLDFIAKQNSIEMVEIKPNYFVKKDSEDDS